MVAAGEVCCLSDNSGLSFSPYRYHLYIHQEKDREYGDFKLSFYNTALSDQDNYTCVVSNEYGNNRQNVSLIGMFTH